MEKHTFGKEYGFQTRAVHTGNDVDAETGGYSIPFAYRLRYHLRNSLGQGTRRFRLAQPQLSRREMRGVPPARSSLKCMR